MTLEETIKKMREKNNDEKFYPLIENMKRRAEKGLLENVTVYDIEKIVDELGKEHCEKSINISEEVFEINEAIEKFNYLDIDDYSEELLEYLILQNFAADIENLNEAVDKIDNYADYNAERAKRRKIANGIAWGTAGTGVALGATAGAGAIKLSNIRKSAAADAASSAKNVYDAVYNNEIAKGASAEAAKAIASGAQNQHISGAVSNAVANAGGTGLGAGLKMVGKGITTGAKAVGKGVVNLFNAAPIAGGVLAGAAGIGLGYGVYRLIKHLRRKRRERQLTEGFLDESENLILFSPEFSSIIKEAISQLSSEEIKLLKENACDDTKELISMFQKETQTLDEAVTYIDNAGNLKTKSAVDYVKDMHYYDTDTQIAKYERKKKKRDYKLISEEIDVNDIKKLSEMSLDDILNEDLFVDDSK